MITSMKLKEKLFIKKAETITTCYFAKEPEGIIPLILDMLLTERKNTRKKIKQTDDPFKKKVLDGLQLAYKVTANSVYGQMGAKTSSICFKKMAACTTSIGRQRIYDAKQGVIDWAKYLVIIPPKLSTAIQTQYLLSFQGYIKIQANY